MSKHKKIFLMVIFIILNLKDFLLTCLFIWTTDSIEKSILISMYSGFIYTQADFRNIQYNSMYYYDQNIKHGNRQNPVMLVFIVKLLLSTTR